MSGIDTDVIKTRFLSSPNPEINTSYIEGLVASRSSLKMLAIQAVRGNPRKVVEEDYKSEDVIKRMAACYELGWRSSNLKDEASMISEPAKHFFDKCNEILGTENLTSFTKEQVCLLKMNDIKIHKDDTRE